MSSSGPSGGKITPLQQMLSSGSGALITSILGKLFCKSCVFENLHPFEIARFALLPLPKSLCSE